MGKKFKKKQKRRSLKKQFRENDFPAFAHVFVTIFQILNFDVFKIWLKTTQKRLLFIDSVLFNSFKNISTFIIHCTVIFDIFKELPPLFFVCLWWHSAICWQFKAFNTWNVPRRIKIRMRKRHVKFFFSTKFCSMNTNKKSPTRNSTTFCLFSCNVVLYETLKMSESQKLVS